MCGILAVLGKGADKKVRDALPFMQHRGLEDHTHIVDMDGCSLAHVRLPIVGTDKKYDQPFGDVTGRWAFTFVGEILDFRKHHPEMECDVQLAYKLWSAEGPNAFHDYDGFWQVAAYHPNMKQLHLLVDYLRQKPLYVRTDSHAVAVCSELDPLVSMGPCQPDMIYLSSAIKWGYCPEICRTPYRSIRVMLPGEHRVLDVEGNILHSECADNVTAGHMSPDEMRGAIEEAIRYRITSSDVPTAVLVSGGLDSSIVWRVAEELGLDHGLIPYHVENNEWASCERLFADPGRVRRIDLNPGMTEAREALLYMQEPLDLGSLLPQVALSKAIHANDPSVRVCITGDGADELYGGYGRSMRYDSQISDIWHELVAWHLPRLDRVMMRNQIEVRSPYLCRWVLEGALALPWHLRQNKNYLRDLFRDILPPEIADGKKVPLRTAQVEQDREACTRDLVRIMAAREEWGLMV